MPVLKLKDDIDNIDFLGSDTYGLIPDSLDIGMPSKTDNRYQGVNGDNIVTVNYGSRQISFDFFVYGSTQKELSDAIARISRMVVRNTQSPYVAGSGYSSNFTPDLGSNSGDSGLILITRRHDENGASKKNERNQTQGLDLSVIYRIISSNFSVEGRYGPEKEIRHSAFGNYANSNVVANSSFEEDTSGWTAMNSAVIARTISQAYVGSASLQITPDNGSADSGAMYTISTTDGFNYTYSLRVRGVNGVAYKIIVRSLSANNTLKTVNFTGTGNWQLVETDFVAEGTSHSVRVARSNSGTDNAFHVDDVRVLSHRVHIAQCSLELEAEPYGSGQSYVVLEKADPGFYVSPLAPYSSNTTNHAMTVISGNDILGDAPALTRIYMNPWANGMIIAREAGASLLRCPSYPTFSGTAAQGRNASIFGQINHPIATAINFYRVRVTSTSPFRVAISTNDGSGYSTNYDVTTGVPTTLGSTGVQFLLHSNSGFSVNDYWRFAPHQVNRTSSTTVTIGTSVPSNQNSVYSRSGITIDTFNFTIPKGARGKYRVYAVPNLANASGDISLELQAGVRFFAHGVAQLADAAHTYLDWNQYTLNSGFMYLGSVDINNFGYGIGAHPNSVSHMSVRVRVRSLLNITGANTSIGITALYLVPEQDSSGFLHIGWGTNTENDNVVFSNFAGNHDYFGYTRNYFINNANIEAAVISSLDETHSGNCITLIPGVDNTLLFLPIGYNISPAAVTPYWKRGVLFSDPDNSTGQTTVVIKPRYLYSE